MPRFRHVLRYLWAAPGTLVGAAVTLPVLMTGGRARRVDGVIEVEGRLLHHALRRFVPLHGGALAMTLGHVVVARDAAALDRTRQHERVHVGQYERWGVFFIPAYFAAALYIAARGGRPYQDNPFEMEARANARQSAAKASATGKPAVR